MRKPKRKLRGSKRISRRGLMLVLSSPSGAGKTTLSRRLLEKDKSIELIPGNHYLEDGPDFRHRAASIIADWVKARS